MSVQSFLPPFVYWPFRWNHQPHFLVFVYDRGGTLSTVNPTLAGTVDLAGRLCGGTVLTIESADIIDSLAVGFSSITVDLTGVSSIFSDVVSSATTQLSSDFQPLLTTVMEPAMRPVIETALTDGRTFAPAQLMPLQAQLMRNNVQDTFQSLVSRGRRFFRRGEEGEN